MTKENTHVSNAIDATADSMFEYDQNAKNILADRQILARILKYTLDEFCKMDIDEIISSIEGEPFVGNVPTEQGLTNQLEGRICGALVIKYGFAVHKCVGHTSLRDI